MKKFLIKYKKAIAMIVVAFLIQSVCYYGSQLINRHMTNYDFTIHAIDDNIPLIPVFVVIYVGCSFWWYLGPLVFYKNNKSSFYTYISGSIIGYLIAAVIFLIIPTTMTRDSITGDDIFSKMIMTVYQNDGGDKPMNLFPSLHCFISVMLLIGALDSKDTSKGYKIFSVVLGVLVCLSTVFVKQHYFIDIVGGVLLAVMCYYIVKSSKLDNWLEVKCHDNTSI